MSEHLYQQYGKCIIPPNTLLYRDHVSTVIQPCMFFWLKPRFAYNREGIMQVWKTQQQIELLFMVKYVMAESRTISAIEEIYGYVFPEQKDHTFDDLDIKHFSLARRNLFVERLYNLGIKGWFSSYDNKIELEICLFNPAESGIQLVELVTKENSAYFRDSLHDVELFPADRFYFKSHKALCQQYGVATREQQYERHKMRIETYVQDELQQYGTEEGIAIRESYNDLRLKLKV